MKITITNQGGKQEIKTEFTATETLRFVPMLNALTSSARDLAPVFQEISDNAAPFIQALTYVISNPSTLMAVVEQWANTPGGGITIAKLMELYVEVQIHKGVYNASQQTPQPVEEPDFQEISLEDAFAALNQFLSN